MLLFLITHSKFRKFSKDLLKINPERPVLSENFYSSKVKSSDDQYIAGKYYENFINYVRTLC
jgi:hypothetical protein